MIAKIDVGRKFALRITASKDAPPCVPAIENSRSKEIILNIARNSLRSVPWQGVWEGSVMHLLIERIAARKHCFVVVVDRYLVGQASLTRQREAIGKGKFLPNPRFPGPVMDRSFSSLTIPCPGGVPLLSNARTKQLRWKRSDQISRQPRSYTALKQALTAIVSQVVAIHSKDGWLLEALNDFSHSKTIIDVGVLSPMLAEVWCPLCRQGTAIHRAV